MEKSIFVPLTDDLLYEHPERILGPVIPFSQQARRALVEPATLGSTTSGLDIKTKLETAGGALATRSERYKASLSKGGRLR